ncbi:hypothetical protein G9A89_015701 [Geosiphon pyriformis]|nr:hypothetical protein G9A89_015701 [Geosiphon pyriformis]
MVYAPITKLDNFTGKEDDTQVWLNDVEKAIAANRWNNVRAIQAIPYFFKDTADLWYQSLINKPQDFNVFKVEFLRYFSNNNSINRLVNTFTTIKQGETEAVITYLGHFHRNLCQIQAIDANYFTASQILNQFIRGLCSSILQHVCPLHPGTLQDAVTCARDFESAESEANHAQAVNLVMNGSSELDSKLEKLIIHQLISSSSQQLSGLRQQNSGASQPQNPNFQNYLSLLITPEDALTNNPAFTQKQPLTSNILPATITEDESLAAIFPFEFEETTAMLLFSGAALEAKPITAKIITADGATKTPISEIDDFLFEVNGIVTSIKVLVMEATQYQALVGNDWLSKVNTTLD